MQSWIIYSLAAVLLFTVHDISLKYVTTSNSLFGTMIISVTAFILLLVLCIFYKVPIMTEFRSANIFILIGAGIALGLSTFFLMMAFKTGAPVSLAIPLIYIGIIILGMWYGYFFLKEPINVRYMIGSLFAIIGILLMFYKNDPV